MHTRNRPSRPSLRAARRRQAGFTLVELLLVLVILGILAALVLPKFTGRTEQARVTAAQTQISTFGTALDAFEVDTGSYPRGQEGLNQLIVQPGRRGIIITFSSTTRTLVRHVRCHSRRPSATTSGDSHHLATHLGHDHFYDSHQSDGHHGASVNIIIIDDDPSSDSASPADLFQYLSHSMEGTIHHHQQQH